MASVICGSVAYDTIMTFDGHFREHILPDKIHICLLYTSDAADE